MEEFLSTTPRQTSTDALSWKKFDILLKFMKKLIFLPLFLILATALSVVWFYQNIKPPSDNKEYKDFLITKGSSASQIGAKLESAGFIKSALAFKIYIQFSGKASRMQTGEFRLSPSFSLFQTVEQLMRGPTEIWVTIPEGLRREEIAQRFAKGLDKNSLFVSDFLEASVGSEGKLFPDTYLFAKDASASSIINKMTKTFSSKTNGLVSSGGLGFDETLILASIIERETKTDDERPMVAGILLNRLNIGMALQVDATVQYAIATSRNKGQITAASWWTPLTREDLAINSPYNTYKFPGLPPGPISNPGLSSLLAAFSPEKNEYFYYIHDKNGQIHYAKTLDEQNANISKYLR